MARRPAALSAYRAIAELAAPAAAAVTWAKAGRAPSALQQAMALGRPARPPNSYVLWVHGASVGETLSALPLVRALLSCQEGGGGGADTHGPHALITAGTSSALERLQLEDLGPRVHVQHRPVDAPSVARRFLSTWRPDALVLMESELWPCIIDETSRANVPIALVNARLSERSMRAWAASHAGMATLRYLLSRVAVILAQSPQMAQRLRDLGEINAEINAEIGGEAAAPLHVESTKGEIHAEIHAPVHVGSTKMLRCVRGPPADLVSSLRYCVGAHRSAWLAASTHAEEEEAILEAHAQLRRTYPELLLVIAPRHPPRGKRLAASASAKGFHVSRRAADDATTTATAVYVCDTLGELPALFELIPIAFIGGSLCPLGGHNILEPAQSSRGCAILHGPHTDAIALAAEALGSTSPPAARRVDNAADLAGAVDALLRDDAMREMSRANAVSAAAQLEAGVLDAVWARLERPLRLPAPPRRS